MTKQATELEYVGLSLRLGAFWVDAILEFLIAAPFLWWIYGREHFFSGALSGNLIDTFLLWILPALLVLVFWTRKQATPGKMLIGATIVDADTGAKPSLRQFLGRYMIQALVFVALCWAIMTWSWFFILLALALCMNFLWIGFDQRKQALHDKLFRTVVVRPLKVVPVRFANQAVM